MLTEKELAFIRRWEETREAESGFLKKLVSGLPMALLFYLPVILFLFAVQFILPDWYAKVSNRAPGSVTVIMIALLLCALFFSYFRMHFKWEMNEQLYRRLKSLSSQQSTP